LGFSALALLKVTAYGFFMEEAEIPLDQVQEQVEHVTHGSGHKQHTGWITWAALLSAILAVLAAVSALYAGSRANEAMMDQMRASDQWSYYQAKGIKSAILESRLELFEKMGKNISAQSKEKLAKYSEEQKEIQNKAEHFEKVSEANFEQHEIFAHAVTFFQIAIAVTAIAVLAKRRRFLFVSGVFGLIGAGYLVQGLLFLHGH
jgi:Ni/Fe-hydrogenase subunit HybB-like protein